MRVVPWVQGGERCGFALERGPQFGGVCAAFARQRGKAGQSGRDPPLRLGVGWVAHLAEPHETGVESAAPVRATPCGFVAGLEPPGGETPIALVPCQGQVEPSKQVDIVRPAHGPESAVPGSSPSQQVSWNQGQRQSARHREGVGELRYVRSRTELVDARRRPTGATLHPFEQRSIDRLKQRLPAILNGLLCEEICQEVTWLGKLQRTARASPIEKVC